jgi:hypothetical protein
MDTSSETITNLSDKVCPLWLLRSVATLEVDVAQSNGAVIRREDGAQSRGSDYAWVCGARIGLEEVVHICGAWSRR